MNKLIIFDCDGVLVDSEMISSCTNARILKSFEYLISEEESVAKFTGMNIKTIRQFILEKESINLPELLVETAKKATLEAMEKELKPLMLPILASPFFKQLKKCIASNGLRENIIKYLQITKQDCYFDKKYIFTASEVAQGKPDPDLFLFAAKQMNYHPLNCLVIEDSIIGIQAAQAAGMPVIGFLAGGHTQFKWYKERIQAKGIPIAYNTKELLKILNYHLDI